MSRRPAWAFSALRAFYRLDPRDAMMVDRAVIRFAETGAGRIVRVPPYSRLEIGLFRVLFTVDSENVNVLFLYRVG